MYAVVKGIPKPENLSKKAGAPKYPFADMEVDDSFVVPYGEMKEGETAEEFKARIYKSARNYASKDFKDRPDTDNMTEKKDFVAAVMTEDDKSDAKAYVAGDVVVWRLK